MIRRRATDFILTTAAVMLAIWLLSFCSAISLLESLDPIWPIIGAGIGGYLLAIRNMQSTVKRAEGGSTFAQWTLDLMFGEQPQPAHKAARKHHNDNRENRATRRKPAPKQTERPIRARYAARRAV